MKNKDSSKYFLVTNFSFEFLELFNNNNNPKGVKAL